jgi:hypothetical protein
MYRVPTQIMQKQKFWEKLVGNFKATEEKSRIRIRIRNLYKNAIFPDTVTLVQKVQ